MSNLMLAREFDSQDQPIEAAQAYEAVIASSQADLTVYLDLAVLYFVCNDGGYAAHHHLSQSFLTMAWDRMFSVLGEAESRFEMDGAIAFWRRYFKRILLGEDFPFNECSELASSSKFLDPHLFLYTSARDRAVREQQRAKAEELLASVRAGQTARERYIRSVLEAAFAHTDRRSR